MRGGRPAGPGRGGVSRPSRHRPAVEPAPRRARASYLDAIRLDPGLASAHANLGLIFLEEGRADEAWRLLARAAELEPGLAVYWEYLARLYEWARRFDAAIPCWERVLALARAGRARLHLAPRRGAREEGRPAEAGGPLPGGRPARARLGRGPGPPGARPTSSRGEFAEAEAAFRAAIRLQPIRAPRPCPAWRPSSRRLPDADLAALAARLGRPGLGPEPRARLLFALAHVLDARGDYARAAAASARPTP